MAVVGEAESDGMAISKPTAPVATGGSVDSSEAIAGGAAPEASEVV